MSIVASLKKLFDPASVLWEESEQHAREHEPRLTPDGDPPAVPDDDDLPEVAAGEREMRFRCRICADESDQGPFCLTCLADTMQPIPAE